MIQKIKEWSGVIALVAIVLLLVLNAGGNKSFGAIKDTSYFDFFNAATGGGFQINGTTVLSASTFVPPGTSTALAGMNFGNCIIYAYATTISASSTATVDCQGGTSTLTALSGVSSGDKVFVHATTTLSSLFEGVTVEAYNASTTNGYITMTLYNGTGGTFTWSGGASTTMQYEALR